MSDYVPCDDGGRFTSLELIEFPYVVCSAEHDMERHKTEESAIASAQFYRDASVRLDRHEGTLRASQAIWPTRGALHEEHA